MEVIELEVKSSQKDIYSVFPLGDIHGGAPDCAEKSIKEKVREVKETENAMVIVMGDVLDCITQNDKRFDAYGLASWVERDDIIESQRKWAVDLFKPIKDNSK